MVQCVRETPKSGNPAEPLTIVGLPTIGNVASSGSPFVGKLDLYCKMAGIPYTPEKNIGGGPKGKIPYIRHGENVVGDSTFIFEYLKNTYVDKTQSLVPKTPQDKAKAIACQRICEDHLYFGLIHFRWIDDKGFCGTSKFIGGVGLIPRPLLPIALRSVRKKQKATLAAHGIGRHRVEDLEALLSADFEALSGFLGDQDYILGAEPSEPDAVVFALLDSCLNDGNDTNLPGLLRKFPNLVDYVQRIRDRYYSGKDSSFAANA